MKLWTSLDTQAVSKKAGGLEKPDTTLVLGEENPGSTGTWNRNKQKSFQKTYFSLSQKELKKI